ncbi:MAG: glycosyltransferase family 4 protein [Gemmataceae bacterium]
MNILQIVQRYPPALGGSEKYFQKLAHFLAGNGHQVSVWTSNALDLEAFWSRQGKTLTAGTSVEDGIEISRFKLLQLPFQRPIFRMLSKIPIRSWQALSFGHNPIMPPMWRACSTPRLRFDAIHTGCFPYAFPISMAARLSKKLKVPLLITPFLHLGNLDNPRNKVRRGYTHPALTKLLMQADAVFVQTHAEFQAVEELGVTTTRIHLQGMGVDLNECTGGNPVTGKDRWGGKNVPILGHLANLSWDKGSTDLLAACEILWKQGLDFLLVLAGPSMPSFEKTWEQFPFKDKVIRTGPLTPDEKKDFFASIDFFALPSRSDSFGIVLLEAWANAKPCVVYKAGGPGSLVQHRKDGLICPCDNIGELASSLENLLKDESLRQQLGSNGQSRIQREFHWQGKLSLFQEVALKLISGKDSA